MLQRDITFVFHMYKPMFQKQAHGLLIHSSFIWEFEPFHIYKPRTI